MDGSLWKYSYDNRNQLTGAGRFWSDWTAVTGQQYGYNFDNIGNRTSALWGSVGNMSANIYAVNGLNEYTNIVTPGCKDILCLAIATNTVTVNTGVADRKGEYFHRQISIANNNGPVWQNVSITSGSPTNGTSGGLVLPAKSQPLVYDADGNLTSDGIWTYQWDAENRLTNMTMESIYGIANSNVLQLTFAYDYMNRRISKTVASWNGTTYVPQSTSYFVYDGWNLIAVFTPVGTIQQSFVWGLDLSGSMDQAGGIGGLLAMANAGTNYFATYDGNGNITGLINGADKSTGARYEYSPFGEVIRMTGPMARANPFRFSTKFCDDESGLVYYGYRYYDPAQGRWIGRDPAPDQLLELYCFNHNAPTLAVDPNGKSPILIAMGTSAVIGGVIGAIENPNHWLGFCEGATAGAVAPLVGLAAATGMEALIGEGIISATVGAASAGSSASYMRSVFDNVANAQSSPWVINNKQQAAMAEAGTFGIVAGAWIGQSAAARGVDVDDAVLDATLTVAGEAGVGAAEAFNAGAEATANAGAALFQQHANDLNGQ